MPPVPEQPTLADVLAAIGALSAKVDQVNAKTDSLSEAVGRVEADTGQMRTEMNVRFDQVADKFETARSDTAAVQTEMREGFAGLKGETALLERYVLDAQRAILRHGQDPHAHPNAA